MAGGMWAWKGRAVPGVNSDFVLLDIFYVFSESNLKIVYCKIHLE